MGEDLPGSRAREARWLRQRIEDIELQAARCREALALLQDGGEDFEPLPLPPGIAAARREQQNLFAVVGHELRTPLGTILGLSEALLDGARGSLSAAQREDIGRIRQSGQQLLGMVQDVLDLARIEQGLFALDISEFQAWDLVEAVRRKAAPLAEAKSQQFEVSESNLPERIRGDFRRLRQVLEGLLENAVKFTPRGGTVGLEASGDASGEILRFSVRDSGIGMKQEELPRLFEPFAQEESGLNRGYEGIGLGLPLIARLADLHGGSLALETASGKGARFELAIPAGAGDGGMALPRPVRDGVTVLVADDQPAVRERIGALLQESGYRTLEAGSGEETLHRLADGMPDVLLLDLEMPYGSGWEVLRGLRRRGIGGVLPVAAMSARALPGDAQRCRSAGVPLYFHKPLDCSRLGFVLRELGAGGACAGAQ